MSDNNRPEPIRSALLDEVGGTVLRHGFFTRQGGVSEGIYAGLNIGLGSQDDPAHVEENRRRLVGWFGKPLASLTSPHQVHSAEAVIVDKPFDGERPKVDAIVTATPGLPIAIATADCGPILFADPQARVIGAAHAGWKGALTGVLEDTIAKMESLGARRENIAAALGPSISAANYEVGPEFVLRFLDAESVNERYFAPSNKDGHALFDLNTYTVDRLRRAGVRAEALFRCTYAEEDLWFSYRRTTHRQEPDYGRQMSAIMLEEH
ncbi:peptidoglycan editing factor PgeF [Tianweitania sediminis]|uniref:Purine nucleoside phosphorylase n=1 Tax=Tianweitania sediminis TaxID=1502156 RepID=A0A8J7R323_9HYPH|nr:peptidoglycan editing factor PgeF [Tianweitania sediminis]MBP0439345.1 peptidoglycan editing factor PgeF [Tianweitania sediminis]